jgi:O-acetyl-ADP-ribose deacetylase (regulator of RNase III)
MDSARFGPLTLQVHRGDITELAVDAVVNAANNQLWMGGGVAGAIKRKGGSEIEAEAVAQGPIPVGAAIVTRAGRLPARYVIHAATMAMDFRTNEEYIRSATRSALWRAQELGLRSIAFPALGAGVGRYPLAEVARIMVEEVVRHAGAGTSLELVLLVAYDAPAEQAFREALERAAAAGQG